MVDAGFLTGAPVSALASLGTYESQSLSTSHHWLVYRRMNDDTIVFAVAGLRQHAPHAFDEAPFANLMGRVGPACEFGGNPRLMVLSPGP